VSSSDEVRELVRDILSDDPAGGWRPAWDRLSEAGLTLVGLREEQGGSGGTLHDLVAVVEEVAAAGVPTPLIENHTARWLLGPDAPDEGQILSAAHSNDLHVADGRLSGVVPQVRWVDSSTELVLTGPALPSAVRVRPADVSVQALPGRISATEQPAVVTLADLPLGDRRPATEAEDVVARLALLRAAALTGAARATYSLTKNYVTTREQFGAPLIRLQPVAAGIAAMSVAVLQARTALDLALERPDDVPTATVARVTAGRSASAVATIGHQLHGAMGVTQEYPLHRLTSLIWSWRDADLPEREWLGRTGELVLMGGEASLWEIGRG
jgi:acyl-CoA dehydrogenase